MHDDGAPTTGPTQEAEPEHATRTDGDPLPIYRALIALFKGHGTREAQGLVASMPVARWAALLEHVDVSEAGAAQWLEAWRLGCEGQDDTVRFRVPTDHPNRAEFARGKASASRFFDGPAKALNLVGGLRLPEGVDPLEARRHKKRENEELEAERSHVQAFVVECLAAAPRARNTLRELHEVYARWHARQGTHRRLDTRDLAAWLKSATDHRDAVAAKPVEVRRDGSKSDGLAGIAIRLVAYTDLMPPGY